MPRGKKGAIGDDYLDLHVPPKGGEAKKKAGGKTAPAAKAAPSQPEQTTIPGVKPAAKDRPARKRGPRKELKPLNIERAVMTREEAAEYLGISVPTLWRTVKAGHISIVTVGKRTKYRQEDLDEYLARSVSRVGAN